MNELKKFLKKLKKYENPKNNQDFSEKNYIKELISKKMKKKQLIDTNELSIKFGTTKEFIEDIFKEINEEKKQEIKNKPKKIKKKREIFQKLKKRINNSFDDKDKNTLKGISLKIILFGIPINFSLYCFLFHPFNFYSWIAYGYTFWLIKKEVVPQIRYLIHK